MMRSTTKRIRGFAALALLALAACAEAPPVPGVVVCGCGYMVFFDFDSVAITRQTQATIRAVVRNANALGGSWRLGITGHTDRAGSDGYNMALSLRRANAVRDALVREGFPGERITIVGRGELQLLVRTADGVREPQNRRVEINPERM